MAEGLARATAPDGWTVYSAGSRPTHLNPLAHEVMAAVGIDISAHGSKGMDDVPLPDADWVITLCAEEECPVARTTGVRLYWPFPDPAAAPSDEALKRFQTVRDAIRERVDQFWIERTAAQ